MFALKSFLFVLAILVLETNELDQSSGKQCGIDNIFSKIGFTPSCVAQTLSLCEANTAFEKWSSEIKDFLQSLKESVNRLSNSKMSNLPQHCLDLLLAGDKSSGIRTVYPFKCCSNRPLSVYCDQTMDGGGWTVIQRRKVLPVRENFFRKWIPYALGFGNLTGEFWLGLDNIHALSNLTLMELKVSLEDFDYDKRHATYDYFAVGSASENYRLELGNYTGDAGDGFSIHSGQEFTTIDRDNDAFSGNCAQDFKGGWWYYKCHLVNLNGLPFEGYHKTNAIGINWQPFRGYKYSLKKVSLAIRPKFRNLI